MASKTSCDERQYEEKDDGNDNDENDDEDTDMHTGSKRSNPMNAAIQIGADVGPRSHEGDVFTVLVRCRGSSPAASVDDARLHDRAPPQHGAAG